MDEYLDTLPPWQREVAETVRRLVHQADPAVEEVIKRRIQPYFVLDGNICALLGTRHHLNVFIYDPIAPDPHGLINQGQGNATARGIQVRPGEHLYEAGLLQLFRAVIANNRAGGWRKVQSQTFVIPVDLPVGSLVVSRCRQHPTGRARRRSDLVRDHVHHPGTA